MSSSSLSPAPEPLGEPEDEKDDTGSTPNNCSSTSADRSDGGSAARQKKSKIITTVLPNDILLGRGALAISNEGNVRFRNIIAGRKDEYISTSRRAKKDTIANEIRNLIASRNGRFLRRVASEERMEMIDDTATENDEKQEMTKLQKLPGVDTWTVADDDVVLAKIKQSLRDKEPDEVGVAAAAAAAAASNHKRSVIGGGGNGWRHIDTNEELQEKRAKHRQGPGLNWNEPPLIGGPLAAVRALGLLTAHQRQESLQQHGSGDHHQARMVPSQDKALYEELSELRERQRMLLNRSMIYGGLDSMSSAAALHSNLDPMARYHHQLDLLSGIGRNNNLDLNLPASLSALDQQRLDLLRGATTAAGISQDSSSSATQDRVIASLRQELERKDRRDQIEALLVQREEDLLLRRLEQERDASLLRLRRQEAMLAAIRQGRPLPPDLEGAASTSLRGRGGGGGLLRGETDFCGQNDLLARRQADFLALLGGSRNMLHTASTNEQSVMGSPSRFGRQTESSANRKESVDQEFESVKGKKEDK